jgi:PIN domain nuclease of toxin-antitoxin system
MIIRASDAVLDTSVILAFVYRDIGWERAESHLEKGIVSTLILAEAVTNLVLRGHTALQVEQIWSGLGLQVVAFDAPRAVSAGLLAKKTRHLGLSLADRACLALAVELGVPAVTADREWSKLDLRVEIRVIR